MARDRRHEAAEVDLARDRFGGLDIPASLTGALVAIALLGIIGGIVGAAIGGYSYEMGATTADGEEIGLAAVIGAIATAFVSFLIGGWAAGRISRYDGVRNGVMAAVWVILLGAIFAGVGAWFGSEYDVLDRAEFPRVDQFSEEIGLAAALTGIGTLVAILVGGALGGTWGTSYHRRADAAMTSDRAAGMLPTVGDATHTHRGAAR